MFSKLLLAFTNNLYPKYKTIINKKTKPIK